MREASGMVVMAFLAAILCLVAAMWPPNGVTQAERPPVLLAPQRIVLPDYSHHAPRPVYHDVETDAEWPPTPRADRYDTESAN